LRGSDQVLWDTFDWGSCWFEKCLPSALVRKLSIIIWNMIVIDQPYINPEGYLYLDQKRKLGLVKRMQKQIDKFGLTTDDLTLNSITSPSDI